MRPFSARAAARAVVLAVLVPAGLLPALPSAHADAPPSDPRGVAHGLGALAPSGPALTPRATVNSMTASVANVPTSADISQYNPPVGNQGQVSSCISWVTGYDMRGWYARRDNSYPTGGYDGAGSYAPMYLFNQVTGGRDQGTSFNANLDVEVSQGIDTRAHYDGDTASSDTDYTHQPTATEHANAAGARIAGYMVLFQGTNQGPTAQQAIEAAIAGGNPVGLGIPVYDNFYNATSSNYYIDGAPGTGYGNHAVFATKYDSSGLWVQNQWGAGWGRSGWAELSWNFVNQYAWQAVTMRVASSTPPTTAPVPPTTVATGTTTAAPTLTPTATDTPVPLIATDTPVPPTNTSTATPVPPTATNTPVPPTDTATTAPPVSAPAAAATAVPDATAPAFTSTTHTIPPVAPASARATATLTPVTRRRRSSKVSTKPPTAQHGRHATAARSRARQGLHPRIAFRDVTIPSHAHRVTLRFSYRRVTIHRRDVPLGRDTIEIDVANPRTGRVLARALNVDGNRGTAMVARGQTWREAGVDLTRFRGRRVRLVFHDRLPARSVGPTIDLKTLSVVSS